MLLAGEIVVGKLAHEKDVLNNIKNRRDTVRKEQVVKSQRLCVSAVMLSKELSVQVSDTTGDANSGAAGQQKHYLLIRPAK